MTSPTTHATLSQWYLKGRTTAQPVADDAGDGSHFADHDLRRDILIHCHDNREHPSLAETSCDVRALIWFPKMQSYIDYHYNSCSYCVAKRTAADPVGTAIRVQRRLKMIEFDHKILEPDVVAATGCAAILTIVDVVARVTMYVPVHTLNTVDTARALYTRWYSLFGSPAVMRMDNAPAYTSAVMQAFHKLMGVRHVDLSAPDNPTHHAMVERRNQIMEKMLDVAISKGDLNSKADLDMYCASAASVCNLEHTYNGHTVLEYLTGEIPRTHRDLVTPADIPEILHGLDSEFLDQLRLMLQEQNSLLQLARDDDARYNAIVRDAHSGNRRTTQFTLKPGDQVSHDGQKYTLLELLHSTPTEPTKALIRSVSSDTTETKTVRYNTLRPLASPRPSRMHSAVDVSDVSVGRFVFFSTPNSNEVKAGIVQTIQDGKVTIVEHQQGNTLRRRFTPLYRNTTNNKLEPKLKPQPHHTPVLHANIHVEQVLVCGDLVNLYVPQTLLDSLRSVGVLDA